MLFQIFRLNLRWDMSKMHYFSNKFSNIVKRWGLSAPMQRPLTFNIDDFKLRDLATLWFFKLIMTKSNFKKTVITSFQWRHRHYITEKRHQNNAQFFSNLPPSPPP